jgi:hypothetical protein
VFAEQVLAEGNDLNDVALSLDELQLIDSAGQWASVVGQHLQKAAPGSLQGALTGFMSGGPVGAVAGAAMGGASAYLKPGAGAPGANAASGGGAANPAALQLLAAILRPEVLQALGAMSAGTSGAQQISVAGQPVPVAAFANMLASVAGQAAFNHHAATPSPGAAAQPSVAAEQLLSLLAEAADDDEFDDHDAVFDAWAEAADLADLELLEAE